ncbi:MAG: S8 family serine peptidase [Candidatus Aminicenantales bacterium]
MRKILLTTLLSVFLLSLVFFLINIKSDATHAQYLPQEDYVPNEVLVKFKEDISVDSIHEAINSVQGKIIAYLGKEISLSQFDPEDISLRSFRLDPYLFHLKVHESIGTEKAISVLSQLPIVEYAEKNIILHLCQTIPNDTYFNLLWGFHNEGREDQGGGTCDADIDAPEAWDIFTGSSNIVVAVIDTGVDYNHVDLAENIWINEDEIPENGIDDDNNGYEDDIYGWDFNTGDPENPQDNDPMDEFTNPLYEPRWYHGTHVAGTIGAVGNNNEGVVGVCWNVKIMALKVADPMGYIKVSDAIHAIDYSIENDAHLSNNSYGWKENNPDFKPYKSALYNAIKRAKSWGKLFIAAAGNDEDNTDNNPHYPSSYDLENIISVAATDPFDNLAGYSNYGLTTVDLGAPGGSCYPVYTDDEKEDIYSTKRYSAYQYMAGTSMAAPHVAGVAALVWGKPVKIWWDQVKEIIMESVDWLSSLSGKCVTGGRLNAYEAIYEPDLPDAAPSNLTAAPTAWEIIELNWEDNSCNEIGFEIQRQKEGEADFSYLDAAKENNSKYEDMTATAGITHTYKVRAYNLAGNTDFTSPVSAIIPTGPPLAPSSLDGWFSFQCLCVHLTWHDNANNEQGFKIERKSEYLPWWVEIAVVGPNTTSYDDNVEQFPDTYFQYRVRAFNPDGHSSYSNIAHVYVPWF